MNDEQLIKKWLNDDLNEAEKKAFEAMEDHQLHLDILDQAQRFKASHFTEIPAFDTLQTKLPERSTGSLRSLRPLLRVAAVLAVLIAVYFFFFFTPLTKVTTLASQQTTTELPDGSSIVLNALSEIKYDEKNWDSNREIQLNGEAYFKVAKGKKFDVVTDDGTVSVLGTQFNIKRRDNYFEVMCYEGIVQVTTNDTIKKLVAGETFRNYSGILFFGDVQSQYPQWTQNISSFKVVPFGEVIAELERQYNIRVINKTGSEDRLFSGGFVQDDLNAALTAITAPLELTYEMESTNVVRLSRSEN